VNGALPKGSDPGSVLPRFSKTISRRFSKAKLVTKVNVEEVAEDMPTRPSTGVSSTLKSSRKSRHGHWPQLKQQEPAGEALPPDKNKKPNTSNTMTKRETMREQLLQFFKSDRVLEAWEGIKESEKKIGQPVFKKDGLWSKFQARSPSAHSDDFATGPLDAQTQLEWLDEETKNLNTYTLKPRSGTAPRVHTISEHLSFHQQTSDKEKLQHDNADCSVVLEEDESIITALPAFPLPPVSSSPPLIHIVDSLTHVVDRPPSSRAL
jgi:hypothetical protein